MMNRTLVSLSAAFFASAVAATAVAQSLPCFAMNDTTGSASSGVTASPFVGSNPSWRAYAFTPMSTLVVESGQWFTGASIREDFMRIELWTDDGSVNGTPGTCLGQGTFSAPVTATHLWLGANFDTPVPLLANTRYWVVFVDAGASLVPEDPAGVMAQRRTRVGSNAWSTSIRMGAPKFRLFCNLLDATGVQTFGPACANTTPLCDPNNSVTRVGTAFVNGPAGAVNPSFAIEGSGFPAGAAATLLVGFDSSFPSIPLGPGFPSGCALNSDVISTVSGTTGTAEIGDQPNSPRPVPFGYVRFPIDVSTAMVGLFFSAQIAVIDSGSSASIPIVTSNGLRGVVQ